MAVLGHRRRRFFILALTAGTFAFSGVASAGTIFFKAGVHNSTTNVDDTSIRWMDDSDASHTQHTLINDWPDLGALAVYGPSILPVGTSTYSGTLIFTAETYASNGCGLFCEALYKWVANTGGPVHGGTLSRLSPPATNSSGSSFESDGEPTSNGNVLYDQAFGSSNPVFYSSEAYTRTLTPGAFGTDFQTPSECTSDEDKNPSPSPVDPSRVAYGGCYQPDPYSAEVLVSGPNGAGKVIAGYDDQPFSDLSWNPAGTRIVDVETGADAGLWVYGPEAVSPSKPFYYALANPGGYYFSSPRFVGTSRIVLDIRGADENLYTIPAACATRAPDNPCTTADVTALTSGVSGTSFYADPTWSPLTPAQLGLTGTSPPPVPDTAITSHPPASTTSQSATFAFTATPASGATFECSLDSAAFAACVSGKSYSALTVASHTFRVRAKNATGTDATPASWTWTITAPAGPTITGFTPTSGKTRTLVTINGTNLGNATSVKDGTLPMVISTKTATQIKAYVWDFQTYIPSGHISVATPAGTVASAGTFAITFGISSVSPQSGPANTLVTINGVGFSPTATVRFNGALATVTGRTGSTQIAARVPSAATTGKVSVTNTTGVVGAVTSWWTFTRT